MTGDRARDRGLRNPESEFTAPKRNFLGGGSFNVSNMVERQMRSSFLIGLIGGQRAMIPLAAVALAAASGRMPAESGVARVLSNPMVAGGAVAFASAELAGDKLRSAPDRVVPIGLAARFLTSAIAGAALAPRRQRWLGAAVGSATATIASHVGWRLRLKSMSRHSQFTTGLFEDAALIGCAALLVAWEPSARRTRRRGHGPVR
jgi:uncharacterized membrane protein